MQSPVSLTKRIALHEQGSVCLRLAQCAAQETTLEIVVEGWRPTLHDWDETEVSRNLKIGWCWSIRLNWDRKEQGGCCFCLVRPMWVRTWFSHFVPLPPCWSVSQGMKRQQDAGLDGEGDREGGKSFLLAFYPPTLPLKLEPPWLVSNHKLWWMCVTYVALSKAAQQIKVLAGINLGG